MYDSLSSLNRPHDRPHDRRWLALEFFVFFVVIPTIIIAFRLAPLMIFFLWAGALICAILYRKDPRVSGLAIWRWGEVNRANMLPILRRFVVSSALLIIAVYILAPQMLFSFPLERPEIWTRVIVLYPLLSVVPQEFIFCTFFFARYRFLFTRPHTLFWASGLAFAYAHVLFINWVAPVLSLFAGYFFAQTYVKTRSLAMVSIEHALYGNMIFTIGLGYYFYGGAIR